MNSEQEAAERAEFIQSVKALLIPVALFLACVFTATATFLIYNAEPLGYLFAGVAAIMIVAAIVALIRFQNTYRARGILKHGTESAISQGSDDSITEIDDANTVDFRPPGEGESDTTMPPPDLLAEHHPS